MSLEGGRTWMWEQVGRPCCQNPLPWDPSLKTLRVGAQAGKCPLGRRVGPAPRPWRGRCAVTGALVHPKSSPPRAVALGITQPKERSRARPGGPAEDAAFLCQPAVLSGLCGRRVGGALRWEGSWPRTGESEAGRHLLACPRLSLVLHGHTPVGCLPCSAVPAWPSAATGA